MLISLLLYDLCTAQYSANAKNGYLLALNFASQLVQKPLNVSVDNSFVRQHVALQLNYLQKHLKVFVQVGIENSRPANTSSLRLHCTVQCTNHITIA